MRQGQAGFTLVELLVSIAIFAMVIAGLAVIYSTAFKQGTGLLTDTRLKASSAVAMRAIQTELAQATRLQLPGSNSSAKHLRGWTNVSPDNKLPPGNPNEPAMDNMDNVAADRHWFHFCIQEGNVGDCGTPQNPVSCLFYYRSADGAPWASTTGIDDATCGTTADSVTPDLLGSSIVGFVAAAEGYFTRTSGGGVSEGNQVRVSFQMRQFATVNSPPAEFTSDSTYSVHFAP